MAKKLFDVVGSVDRNTVLLAGPGYLRASSVMLPLH